jgi:hypothetical protein
MKRVLTLVLGVALCLAVSATAAYADRATGNSIGPSVGPGDPTVISPDDFPQALPNGGGGLVANGASWFWYADLQDNYAKNEGGYTQFDAGFAPGNMFVPGTDLASSATATSVAGTADYWVTAGASATGGYTNSPHGGYASSTNKCKVCHAVHRAEGAYYLLRADSEGDACDYCHIGGGAHSDKIVYDLNPAGTDTTNGHTIGASTSVPDSSVNQTATPVVISGVDADMNPVVQTINVRVYDPQRINMYRFSRHHSQAGAGTGSLSSNFKLVGPTSLSCLSCHQQHQAPAQLWQPSKYDPGLTADTPGGNPAGFKLLKRYPSGSYTAATVNGDGNYYVKLADAVKVPETTITAGVNYSTLKSNETTYSENGVISRQPTWISQGWEIQHAGSPGWDPTTVNEYALSVWCADCHNLDIGGATAVTPELGFKAHTERTHPAPYQGAGVGPAQCYSCHRNDLSVSQGKADPAGYGMNQPGVTGTSSTCSQCHYGTASYAADLAQRQTDFPHSGSVNDVKLLGSYTASVATTNTSYVPAFSALTITESNLDAVCLRCHPGIGVNN